MTYVRPLYLQVAVLKQHIQQAEQQEAIERECLEQEAASTSRIREQEADVHHTFQREAVHGLELTVDRAWDKLRRQEDIVLLTSEGLAPLLQSNAMVNDVEESSLMIGGCSWS